MSGSTEFLRAVPQLPSTDFEETIRFYTEKLGFSLAFRYDDLLIFQKGSAEIQFWKAPKGATLGQDSSCYVRVTNIGPLFETFRQKAVPFGYELRKQPWGMNEFQVNDPDGIAIRFGEPVGS